MKNHLKTLFKTESGNAATLLRLTLALVILPHGLQKTLGWFGGYGFTGTMGFFTETLGIPALIAALVIAAESLGALALIVGFFTRFCAAAIAIVMLGAISMAHWQHGFFMDWYGNKEGQGVEYHLLVIGIAIALVITGAGKLSVDKFVEERIA